MKNKFKLLWIIAIVAIIGFSMVVCDNGNDNGNGKDNNLRITITGVNPSTTFYNVGPIMAAGFNDPATSNSNGVITVSFTEIEIGNYYWNNELQPRRIGFATDPDHLEQLTMSKEFYTLGNKHITLNYPSDFE